jgi:uncharacterized membrane protein
MTEADRPTNDRGKHAGRTLWNRLTWATGLLGLGVTLQRRASIAALLGAAAIVLLAGLAAVAVDLGTAYLAKVADQRAVDSAAHAGALADNASSSVTTKNSAVNGLATLNGRSAGAAVASLVPSPSGTVALVR